MQNEQILNQEQLDQEIPGIIEAITAIYAGQTEKISYAETYQAVFRLCKRGLHQHLIEHLSKISKQHFHNTLSHIPSQEVTQIDFLDEFREVIEKSEEAIERLMEILLYVETNYFYQCKREYESIKDMLTAILWEKLEQNKKILNKIATIVTELHLQNKNHTIEQVLKIVHQLDCKETFLQHFFIRNYEPIMKNHYKNLTLQKIQNSTQKQYFLWAKEILQSERTFLLHYLKRNNGKKPIQLLMKSFYQGMVGQNKKYIYQKNPQSLFRENTTECLELLSQKNEEEQIQEYNDWFIEEMKKKVESYDKAKNEIFLQQFIDFYEEVSKCLTATKKFNIKYKAIFFFQQWINGQKMNLSKRINFYIESTMKKNAHSLDQTKFFNTFHVLFKLLKEKDFFEKDFRQALIFRHIYNDKNSPLEHRLLEIMVGDCGKQWAQKIISLKDSLKQINNEAVFRPIAFEDSAWPFERKKMVARLPPEMQILTNIFDERFREENKAKNLEWHCFIGSVTLQIKFNSGVKMFKLDTCMTAILLYLQALKFKTQIVQILKLSDYTFEDIKSSLLILSEGKILTIGPLQNINQEISLNLDYVGDRQMLDLTQEYREKKLQCNQQEELRADRKLMVEALIIKLMKSSKIVTMEELYKKVTPMIESRGFNFNKVFVDSTFKSLISKNFIRNLEDGTFSYIAS